MYGIDRQWFLALAGHPTKKEMVAGTGLEPVNKGYEPFELPVTLSGDITLVFPSSQKFRTASLYFTD